MADELRWEGLSVVVSDGTTSSDAAAEFRNRTNGMIHLRDVRPSHQYKGVENDELAEIELSKAPTYQGATNNSPFFSFRQLMAVSTTTGAAVDDGATHSSEVGMLKGKGQLTLEPNESVFVNVSKSSGGTVRARYMLGYEFA